MRLLQRTQYNYGRDHLNKHDAQAPLAVQYWVPHWITLIAQTMSPMRDPQFSCSMWLRCYLQLYWRDPFAPTLVSYAMNAAVASVSSQAKGRICRSAVHRYHNAVPVLNNAAWNRAKTLRCSPNLTAMRYVLITHSAENINYKHLIKLTSARICNFIYKPRRQPASIAGPAPCGNISRHRT